VEQQLEITGVMQQVMLLVEVVAVALLLEFLLVALLHLEMAEQVQQD
jgi:hypothetical protein